MLRKLLLLLLIGFAFTEVNAQGYMSFSPGCGAASYEFETLSNGIDAKPIYTSMSPTSGLWGGHGISGVPNPSTSTNLTIYWDGAQWLFEHATFGVLFTNVSTSFDIPLTGWVSNNTVCALDVILTIYDPIVLGTNTEEEFSDIKIYPNPSTGFINISNLKENSRVVISNITGQVVKDVVVGVNDNRIDIQDLAQGFYFVSLEGKKTIKLLKR